jgi:hyperosmotically inducible protein
MIGGAGLFLRYVRQRTDPVLVEAQDRSSCLASTETKHFEDKAMKSKIVLTTLALCALFGSTAVMADKDSDTDRSHPGNFVKDSAITTKIKSKLAAEHITSLGRIHVDTDKDGVVWLSGTARSQAAIDKAVSIARDTEHVVSVHSDIKIKSDD